MSVSQADKKGYQDSFVTTLLFSGVQIYQIIVRIVRSKFAAMLIGPEGMGIMALLHSTTDLISASTNLGLSTSSVKTVAEAHSAGNLQKIAVTVAVLRRLVWLTGVIGLLICAALAPFWSQQSFGNFDFTWSFVFVSVIILIEQLNKGELSLLQGLQQKRYLARANIIGQTVSLILTVPLYYFWGLKAIVWVLVCFSFMSYAISKYYTRKLTIERTKISWKQTFAVGSEMVKLGFFLSLQFLLAQVVLYFVRNYVSLTGGVEEVGLYSAGTTIVNMYLGLVFTAMATGYYPLLAATKCNEEMKDAVMKQAEISMLLLVPLVIAFLVFIKPVILILYSDKFLPIEGMLYWAMGATLLKALGWSVSYTILAKAKPIYFFYNELFSMLYTFPLTIFGYKYFGLTGFGIAMLLGYLLYLLQEMIVVKKLFNISFNSVVWRLFLFLNLPILCVAIIKISFNSTITYIIGLLLLLLSSVFVYFQLDKRMNLSQYINRGKQKFNYHKE